MKRDDDFISAKNQACGCIKTCSLSLVAIMISSNKKSFAQMTMSEACVAHW